jgi:hypothetical protein
MATSILSASKLKQFSLKGRRPLFSQSGDHYLRFFEHLEQMYKPQEVIQDYDAVHSFLSEVASCLSERHQKFFEQIIGDPFPGYDLHRQRVTRILPNQIVGVFFRASDMTMNSR